MPEGAEREDRNVIRAQTRAEMKRGERRERKKETQRKGTTIESRVEMMEREGKWNG